MSTKKHIGLTRRSPSLMALEQRFMFDGAAIDSAHDTFMEASHVDVVPPKVADVLKFDASTASIASTAQIAQQQVRTYLSNATDAQLFNLFNGGKTAPDSGWTQRLAELREALNDGTFKVNVVAMEGASQFSAIAAFAKNGPNDEPTIFINAFWFGMFDAPDATRALVEELGHAFDAFLNPLGDTQGDEGEAFADSVMDGVLSPELSNALQTQNDQGTVTVDGVSYEVEFASLNFSNAYEMVYDQDNDTATTSVTNDAIDVSERWADKEQNSHFFNATVSLAVTRMSDGTGNQNFSGNDISGSVAVTIGGNTFYGWISRPIKSNGIVRGFYFWTDTRFTTLAAAQSDGNQDGDSTVLNNRGFLLVVDQAWFDSQIASTGVTKTINNTKDGNDGTITVANVGSSSDRVDAALNSVMPPNSVPSAANDTLTVLEDSGTTTVAAASGLLSNDSDVDNNALTITGYTISGVVGTQTVGSTVTIAGVGDIRINADGSYTFAPASNYNGSVPPITYTVSDGVGGTATAVLSISVTPANDPPVSTNDSVSVAINTPKVLGVNDFGSYSDPDSNPLTSIKITTLPTSGTLESWNGSSWVTLTGTPTILISDVLLGNLRYVPANGSTGSPTLQFQVYDGGLWSTSSYTLTLNIAGNLAPTAVADTNTVVEAGCSVTATPATGNVITDGTDDSDSDGGAVTVTSVTSYGNVQSVAVGSTSGSNGTAIAGLYGTLTIGANGTYSYSLNNSLATIDAMNSGNTKTETFTYTVSDGQGGTASTTLTLTVNGTNDAPVGADDFASFEEGANQTAGNYGKVTIAANGALANDTDKDNPNADLTVKLVDGTTPPGSTDVVLSGSSPISTLSSTVTDAGGSSWTSVINTDSNLASQQVVWTNAALSSPALDKAGNQLKVYRVGSGATNATLVFSDNVALFNYENTDLYVQSTTNSNTSIIRVDITGTTTTSSTTISTTSTVSGISAGYTVTGTNIPAGTTVVSVDSANKTVTLSNSVNIVNTSLTFHNPNAISLSATQEYFQGTYGYLILNQNGSYTYTLTTDLTASQVVNEQFTYTVVDPSNGCTGTAKINIRAFGVDAPELVNDTLVVYEDSGNHKTFNGSPTGSDLLQTNDANGTTITLGDVVSFKVAGDSTTYTSQSSGTADSSTNKATIAGVGTLRIYPDGSISFDPVDNYIGPVPTVTYTRTGSDSLAYTANLTITIDAVDDASALSPDTKSLAEDQSATGNVLNNDSDVDSALTVASYSWNNGSSVSFGTVGSATPIVLNGVTVGSLTLNSNGSYSFTPAANWNGIVPQITYTSNTGSTSTLDITVTPVNDPPSIDLDASASGTGWSAAYTNQGSAVSIADTDASISDVDDTNMESASVVLTNLQTGDSLNFDAAAILSNYGITATSSTAGSTMTVSLTGARSLSDYQNAIKAITFGSTGFSTVDRVVSVKVNDGDTDSNIAYTKITVSPDARSLTVTGTTVNEASPYVQFQVAGASGQWVSLALSETTASSGNATQGIDYLPNLQYFNGTNWVDYTTGPVQIPQGASTLLVRTPVVQDLPYEGAETLKLTATNQAGTSASANSTIIDNGTGNIFLGNNNTTTPNVANDTDPNGPDYPTYLDDDRPVSVNTIVVNEASPYAVLTITANSGQVLNLAWTDLTAKNDINNSAATDGSDDFGPSLQYWNGTTWANYSSSVTVDVSGVLYVRTNVINDDPYEGLETLSLEVTKASSGNKVYGSVVIADDGTGTKYPDDDPTNGIATNSSNLNDDRTITVTGGLTFNELSTYATFTVSAVAGAEINLVLGNTTSNTDADATISAFTTSYSEDGGATWISYTWNGTTGSRPTVPANGAGSSLYGTVLVRVNITSEEEGVADVYEGPETFSLTANYATNNSITATAIDTITDDGTGKIDSNGDGGADEGGTKENDNAIDSRTIDVVGGIAFNEASTYATFTVTGDVGSAVNLELGNTAATSDTDATISGFTIQYNTGSGWTSYIWNGTSGNRPTIPAGGTVSVRINISSEADTPYEGSETFTLKASYATNANISDTDTDSVIDDGTGKIDTNGDGGADEGGTKDDDRALSVNSITVNEGGGYAVFTVSATAGQTMTLALGNGTTNPTATSGTDYTNALEYWNGSAWVSYTAGFTVPGTANAAVSLYVRIAVTNDTTFENAEDFKLTAAYTSGASRSATGVATIVDDGTGTKYDGTLTNGSPTTSTSNLDDDRVITVTGGDYNENSPRAVFTVNANAGQILTLDVQNAAQAGKAPTGDDEGKPNDSLDSADIYYSVDGGATWLLYNGPITAGSVPVLVAVDITNERDNVYEGEEQLKLVVSSGSKTASGYASIFDDGTGTVTQNITSQTTQYTGANDPAVTKDDDRPKVTVVLQQLNNPAPSVILIETPEPTPVAKPADSFNSTLTPIAPALKPIDPPQPLVATLTSSSGTPFVASETAAPGLNLYSGVTDQFIQTTDAVTKISLPYDAFIHSNKDAVIKLQAKQADDSPLPRWVEFDATAGTFSVNPPKDFKGKIDLKVIARDDEGREAVAIFQMFVGEQNQAPKGPVGRNSLTDMLRMAGKRPVNLIRVSDGTPALPVRETVQTRVRAG